jgi:hypothetical protein
MKKTAWKGRKKEMKKTFCIVIISLLLFTAILLPSVGAETIQKKNIDEITFAEIGMMLKRNLPTYEKDIDEIIDYLDQYYKDNGIFDENFIFPEYLQVKFEKITNEVLIQQINHYGKITPQFYVININDTLGNNGGGINQIKGPYFYHVIYDWGLYFKVWLDDANTRSLSMGSIFSTLLGIFGAPGILIAFMIAGNIWYVQNANQGNGVIFDGRYSYNPLLPRFYCANAKSQ